MRIAIDARELRGKPTGVGRLLGEILAAWKTLPAAQAHEVILCTPDSDGGTLWEQVTLPRLVGRARADVLFAPGYSAPLRCPAPVVVAIHDVSFAAHPEWFAWKEGLRRRTLSRLSARRAAAVVTISEFSKGEIVRHFRVDPAKVEVIYPGVSRLADPKGPRRPDWRRTTSDVLFVGSIFNRRHVPELIDGFARLARRRPDARLEIVGDNRTTPRVDVAVIAARTGVAHRIQFRSYISDEELAERYREARAFAFLSDYEGFGLTPLEALAAGIPIVVLDTPIAREIYGPAALYVSRPDPAEIEAALERALFDEPARAALLAAADGVLARYSWQTCASAVLDVLVRAASRP